MNNIIIGIKRFLKNKNTVTIIAIVAALGILYWAYYYRIQKATQPVSVPYATKEIGPRELITSDMVSIKKVPAAITVDGVETVKANIIGKYVLNTAVIPEGSLFYKSMIVDWDELPSSLYENIKDDNTVIYLPVNLATTYGNSIYPGNYIDLYFKSTKTVNNASVVYMGKFIESIEVLAVVDKDGNSVFETAGDPLDPAYLMFSVPDKNPKYIFSTIKKAMERSYTLFPVPRNAQYSDSETHKETRVASEEIWKYINDTEKNVDQDIVSGGK